MTTEQSGIPRFVIKRLTKYLAHIQNLCASGMEWVSSHELADALDLTSSTVRQDLSHLDFSGVSKRGYETCRLQKVLASILGADAVWHMVVVGAGNLGRALAMHEEFSRCGFLICGIFDCDEKKIGKKVSSLSVESMKNLPLVIKQRKVDIGIIAVPSSAAQKVAEVLIGSGVRGILNLASTHIAAPANIAVIDARIVASLHELSYAIKMKGK